MTSKQEEVNGNGLFLIELMEKDPDQAGAILKCYAEKTGRDYWSDAGDPRKAIRAVLKRGSIDNEVEYYLLKEVVIDTASKQIKDKERPIAEAMLAAFEESIVRPG